MAEAGQTARSSGETIPFATASSTVSAVVNATMGAAESSVFSDFLHSAVFVLLLQSRAAVEDICAPTVSAFSIEYVGCSLGTGSVAESFGGASRSVAALPFSCDSEGGSSSGDSVCGEALRNK